VSPENTRALLEAVIRPGDRVCLEGDNQKQADIHAKTLMSVDHTRIHDLHIVQSCIVLQSHLDLFDRGIARNLDFSYSEPQGAALARALLARKFELGAIHTYLELFTRYFMDLTPRVALIAAVSADHQGNLYHGPKAARKRCCCCWIPAAFGYKRRMPENYRSLRSSTALSKDASRVSQSLH
jgi:malonate decarboxylase alpha subunit